MIKFIKNKIEYIRENDLMPKKVCIVGSVFTPPLLISIIIGCIIVIIYILNNIIPPIPSKEIFCDSCVLDYIMRYVLPFILGALLWVVLAMGSYISCHKYWHGLKPSWAQNPEEIEEKFEIDYMDCPECEEVEPDKWHYVGECIHFGTTP